MTVNSVSVGAATGRGVNRKSVPDPADAGSNRTRASGQDQRRPGIPFTMQVVDEADRDQARVFLAMLDDEIEAVATQLEEARSLAASARARGRTSVRALHDHQAAGFKDTLRDLHRQTAALRRRFDLG